MKTKREVLEYFVKYGTCKHLKCSEECPYNNKSKSYCYLSTELKKIGARAILRQNRKKFDINKILTCVTADKAKVGMKGYFADYLSQLKTNFNRNALYKLTVIYSEDQVYRFGNKINDYALFYPIEEMEK